MPCSSRRYCQRLAHADAAIALHVVEAKAEPHPIAGDDLRGAACMHIGNVRHGCDTCAIATISRHCSGTV